MGKDAYWFKHDSNASRDLKLMQIKAIYGLEGIGMFWSVLEVLREQKDYSWTKSQVQILAKIIDADPTRMNNFITDCERIELFLVTDGKIYSRRLCEDMGVWESKRRNRLGKKAAESSDLQVKKTKVERINNENETNQEHERRGEEIKVKKKEEDKIPGIDEFLSHAKVLCDKAKLNFNELSFSIESKYHTWVADGWKDGNGNKIKVWKTKLANTLPHLKPIREPKAPTNTWT